MFGNKNIIDESSCHMIDDSDYEVVDDIKEERRRGPSHYNNISNSHLCEEGDSHDRSDRQTAASYNRTPSERAYAPPNRQYVQPGQPYVQPRQPSVQPQRPVQTTVMNGRTYQRPVPQPSQNGQTPSKASAAIITLIFLCIAFGCMGFVPVLITCIIMIVLISKAASKTDENGDAPKLRKLIPIAFIIVITVFILNLAGSLVLAILGEMLAL